MCGVPPPEALTQNYIIIIAVDRVLVKFHIDIDCVMIVL